jgi:hypothetical protein
MAGPNSSRATATVHSSSSSGGSGAPARAAHAQVHSSPCPGCAAWPSLHGACCHLAVPARLAPCMPGLARGGSKAVTGLMRPRTAASRSCVGLCSCESRQLPRPPPPAEKRCPDERGLGTSRRLPSAHTESARRRGHGHAARASREPARACAAPAIAVPRFALKFCMMSSWTRKGALSGAMMHSCQKPGQIHVCFRPTGKQRAGVGAGCRSARR